MLFERALEMNPAHDTADSFPEWDVPHGRPLPPPNPHDRPRSFLSSEADEEQAAENREDRIDPESAAADSPSHF